MFTPCWGLPFLPVTVPKAGLPGGPPCPRPPVALCGPLGGPREIKSSACRDSGLRVISVGSVRGRCGPT